MATCETCGFDFHKARVALDSYVIVEARHAAHADILLAQAKAEIERLREQNERWKAAAMLNDASGDPDGITPDHLEREIERLREENDELRSRLKAIASVTEDHMPEREDFQGDLADWMRGIAAQAARAGEDGNG